MSNVLYFFPCPPFPPFLSAYSLSYTRLRITRVVSRSTPEYGTRANVTPRPSSPLRRLSLNPSRSKFARFFLQPLSALCCAKYSMTMAVVLCGSHPRKHGLKRCLFLVAKFSTSRVPDTHQVSVCFRLSPRSLLASFRSNRVTGYSTVCKCFTYVVPSHRLCMGDIGRSPHLFVFLLHVLFF